MRAFQLMAKPTSSVCNLDCQYCFYLEKPHLNQRRMSDEVLERYISSYLNTAPQKQVTFLWQGGEPTIAGLDFYQKVVELQQRHANGKEVSNSLQTNGVLLNESWCEFLHNNQFLVGLSIDGPEELHDAYRVTKGQKGTFRQVMQAAENLKKFNVDFNTLTVVHDLNAKQGERVYQFLKQMGATYMQFIPLMGDYRQKATARDYGQMMIAIFDAWYKEDIGKISVQFIEQWFMAFLGMIPNLCIFRPSCGDQLVIEQNGDIYSCDHYVYPEYKIGNLIETPLVDITNAPKQTKFRHLKPNLSERCQQCQFKFACYGGCPKHRTVQGLSAPHNQLCEAYYTALSHMAPYLRHLAMQFRLGRLQP